MALGEVEELRSSLPRAELLDFADRLVVPGLWDAHIHFYYWSLSHRQVRLSGCGSSGELLSRVEAWMEACPGSSWITGWGWNETLWDPPFMPGRRELDAVTGDRPALLWRSDMHSALANTPALEAGGLMAAGSEVEGGVVDRAADGAPTGILRELAIAPVRSRVPEPDEEAVLEAMREGVRLLHRRGVTGICDQRMKDYTDGPRAFSALARLERQRELPLRVSCNLAAHDLEHALGLGLRTGFGSDRLRLGHVKFFLDGTLGSRTAWMLEPFLEAGTGRADDRGMIVTPLDELEAEVRRAHRGGLSVSIHAIGTRANRACLEVLERLPGPTPPVPHRIEHVQFLAEEDLGRLAAVGVTASMQPAHALDDMDTVDAYLGPLGDCAYRFASLGRAGTLLAFGSDAPVADFDPFYGIRGAVLRRRPGRQAWYPKERMSVEDTLRAYTGGAARAAGWGDLAGRLVPGMRADLAVLDTDLFARPKEPVQVLLTMFDAEIVYRLHSS
ncbi:MAG: amidohydrolase [Armatimonadetes bacterium]|nr:amidohydrolase [Armatimonadota bacterium]